MTGCAGWPMMPVWRLQTSNENLLARIGQDLHDGPIQLVSLLMLKVTDPTATKPTETSQHRI